MHFETVPFQFLTERRKQIAGKFRRRALFGEVGKRVQNQPLHAPLAGEPSEVLDGLLEYGVAAGFVTRLALHKRHDRVFDLVGRGFGPVRGQRLASCTDHSLTRSSADRCACTPSG